MINLRLPILRPPIPPPVGATRINGLIARAANRAPPPRRRRRYRRNDERLGFHPSRNVGYVPLRRNPPQVRRMTALTRTRTQTIATTPRPPCRRRRVAAIQNLLRRNAANRIELRELP